MEADSDHFVSSDDTDEELQELFAAGVLKPGLNELVDSKAVKKEFVNNVPGLKSKLKGFKNSYKWIERLDIVTDPAPIAPEMALQIKEQEQRAEIIGSDQTVKGQLDEFKRESLFHRQAQAAVLEGLQRLKSLSIPTRRPDDYFAEMAKTDQHMQKVRAMLVKKQAVTERIEKVRKIREQKKMSKQIQAEARLKKQNEKKHMMDEVKKFRKGIRKDLNFLDDKKDGLNNKNTKRSQNKAQVKRKYKETKFGYGGKKRGLKRNTKDSTSDLGGGGSQRPHKKQVQGSQRPHKKQVQGSQRPHKKQVQNKRPGKSVRQKMKANKKR